MKNFILLSLTSLFIYSCSSAEKSYDDKVKEVCNCFESKKNANEAPMPCFKLQHDLSETVGEQKTDFIKKTNECAY